MPARCIDTCMLPLQRTFTRLIDDVTRDDAMTFNQGVPSIFAVCNDESLFMHAPIPERTMVGLVVIVNYDNLNGLALATDWCCVESCTEIQ